MHKKHSQAFSRPIGTMSSMRTFFPLQANALTIVVLFALCAFAVYSARGTSGEGVVFHAGGGTTTRLGGIGGDIGKHVSTSAGGLDDYCLRQSTWPRDLKVAQRPLMVYVGAGGVTQPGFVGFNYSELDITAPEHFRRLMCPGSVDVFFSEHTLEHIALDKHSVLFELFLQYLKPGGFLRFAIPPFPESHVPTELDTKYGHVGFASAGKLRDTMLSVGYANVTILEQVHFSPDGKRVAFTSRRWDECEGRVRRSFRHDPRNLPYLRRRYADIDLVENNDIDDVINSTDYVPIISSIIQGYRPHVAV